MVDAEAIKGGDILGGLGIGGEGVTSTIGTVFFWIFILLLVFGIVIGIVVFLIYRKLYSQNIFIFGRVGHHVALIDKDKGRFMRLGISGDTLLKFRKLKKSVAPPTLQMGKNTWWYWRREDGEYINIRLEDIDEKMKKAGAYFVDQDMRLQRIGIERNLAMRMQQQKWWDKYGTAVMSIIMIVMITIALIVLFTQLTDVAKALDKASQSVGRVADNIAELYEEKG